MEQNIVSRRNYTNFILGIIGLLIASIFIISYFVPQLYLPEMLYLISGIYIATGIGYNIAGIPGLIIGLGILLSIWIVIFRLLAFAYRRLFI